MSAERLLRILSLVTSDGAVSPTTAALCDVSVDVAAVTGGSLMLMSGETPQGSLYTTDAVSSGLEELQFTLGEGPCLDAYHAGWPVVAPDLGADGSTRWPGFTPGALELGARAVFGFPLTVGVIRLGALNLYRDQPGGLSEEQHADLRVVAEVAARTVVELQADTPSGTLAHGLTAGADFHLVVHQASGMVSVQLSVDVDEALVRLRAYAFAEGRTLSEVATSVVRRELYFGDAGADRDGLR